MHNIYAPNLIRAEYYAASLGLDQSAWRAVGSPRAAEGVRGHTHILPGVSDDLRAVASRNGAKQADTMLVDLTGVA